MRRSVDRVLTTHVGSLPRPDDLLERYWGIRDGAAAPSPELDREVAAVVSANVVRQRAVGIDVVNDGEADRVDFASGIITACETIGDADMVPGDLAEVRAANALLGRFAHRLRLPRLGGPLAPRDPGVLGNEIQRLRNATTGIDPDDIFMTCISPGELTFLYPNEHYVSQEEYLEAAVAVLRPEYEAIAGAGFNLQIDSPDAAMAGHCLIDGRPVDHAAHLARAVEAVNVALANVPSKKVRFHVCWGNYLGPHHLDRELRAIVRELLRIEAGFLSIEGANPRHEHEWEVWRSIELPDDKALILGTIDVRNTCVEHPALVAQRLERLAVVVGRERIIGGTDCGFATFGGMHFVEPGIAWMKLEALVAGAALASKRLYRNQGRRAVATQ